MLVKIFLIVTSVLGADECVSLCNHEKRLGLQEISTTHIKAAQECQQANYKLQNEFDIAQNQLRSWRDHEPEGLRTEI